MAQNRLSAEEQPQGKDESSVKESEPFVIFMLDNQIDTLSPRVEFGKGVIYPEAVSYFRDKNTFEIDSILSKLSDNGFLEGQLVDRVITCPVCNGSEVYSKYQCDKCKSLNISHVEILIHPLCGYSGSRSSFLPSSQGPGYAQCPKCKRVFATTSKKDITSLGKLFECDSCNNRFDAPKIVHKCKICDSIFTYNEAKYRPVYKYSLSAKSTNSFMSGHLSMPTIVDWFKNQGFIVETSKEITGKSGTVHRFDVVVSSTGTMQNLLLGDFSVSLDEKTILATFAKRYDTNPDAKSFVLTHNKASKAIENLSNLYGISIIYMDAIGSSSLSLDEQLRNMIGGVPQTVPNKRVADFMSSAPVSGKEVATGSIPFPEFDVPSTKKITTEEKLSEESVKRPEHNYLVNDATEDEVEDDVYLTGYDDDDAESLR
jgi:hypothetical protein